MQLLSEEQKVESLKESLKGTFESETQVEQYVQEFKAIYREEVS